MVRRIQLVPHRYDWAGKTIGEDARRTARLTIEEVLGDAARLTNDEVTGDARRGPAQPCAAVAAAPRLELPRRVPRPAPARRSRRPRARRRPRHARRVGIVALTLGLATATGVALGSGLFNSADRFNAERLAAQRAAVESYVVPEVPGHPGAPEAAGAAPERSRSDNIREFLGLASVF
jgi:hypothetical protein